MEDDRVMRVTGDVDDVFSKGFICPKGGSLGALHHDPDRLRTPLVRRFRAERGSGHLVEATWDEAFEEVDRRLTPILAEDRNGVALYAGNPSAHNLASLLYGRVFNKALGTRNLFSASTVDQMPKHVSAGHMFGGVVSIPHGWGHDVDGSRLSVARAHAGVNSNVLGDEQVLDVPSGNAVLNGIPVTVAPAG